MIMWPISMWVNSSHNHDEDLLHEIESEA